MIRFPGEDVLRILHQSSLHRSLARGACPGHGGDAAGHPGHERCDECHAAGQRLKTKQNIAVLHTRLERLLCSHKSSAEAAGPRRLLRVALPTCRQPGIPRRGLPISSWPQLDKYFEVKSHRGIKNINVLRSSQVTKTFLSSKGNLTGGDFFLWKGAFSEAVLARQRKTLSTHSVWELLETHLGITGDTLHPRPPPRCPLRPSTATLQGLPEGPSPA